MTKSEQDETTEQRVTRVMKELLARDPAEVELAALRAALEALQIEMEQKIMQMKTSGLVRCASQLEPFAATLKRLRESA